MDLLKGKVAVVTGAARGIGRMIALRFAQEGADVAFTDLTRDENMDTLEKELSDLGVKGKGYESDASDFDQAQQTVEQVVADFGKVDVLVNNAGIFMKLTPVEEIEESVWDRIYSVNVKGIYFGARFVIPEMKKTGGGVIINTASMTGHRPGTMQSAYASSKGAVITLTKALASELVPF